jgi:hypothetical protein
MDIRQVNFGNRLGMFAIILAFLLAVIGKFAGQPTVEDPFHTGEFLASATNLYFGGSEAYRAVLIHGLSDILPALFAQSFWGLDQHFIPTLTIYRVLDLASLFLLITAAFQLSKLEIINSLIILLAIVLIGPVLVGYRDLVLLFTINIFFFLQKNRSSIYKIVLLQIVFGLSTAFGVFWSYDRGLIGTISLGITVLLCLRRNKLFLLAIVIFIVTTASLGFTNKLFSIERYINNILTLIAGSSDWGYGLKVGPVVLTLFAVFVNVGAIIINYCTYRSDDHDGYALPNFLLLCMLGLLMLKVAGINRADLMHIYQSYWIPMLLLVNGSNVFVEKKLLSKFRINNSIISGLLVFVFFIALLTPWFGNSRYVSGIVILSLILIFISHTQKNLIRPARFILLVMFVFPFGYLLTKAGYSLYAGEYAWLKAIRSPSVNTSLATPGVRWASERLHEGSANCIFDLSNNGVINALAKLPTCTEYIYPVYASPKYESRMIEQLQASSPPIVIYSSTFWSYSIDERSMAFRFPKLDQYLRASYPHEECRFGYCVRFK